MAKSAEIRRKRPPGFPSRILRYTDRKDNWSQPVKWWREGNAK